MSTSSEKVPINWPATMSHCGTPRRVQQQPAVSHRGDSAGVRQRDCAERAGLEPAAPLVHVLAGRGGPGRPFLRLPQNGEHARFNSLPLHRSRVIVTRRCGSRRPGVQCRKIGIALAGCLRTRVHLTETARTKARISLRFPPAQGSGWWITLRAVYVSPTLDFGRGHSSVPSSDVVHALIVILHTSASAPKLETAGQFARP